MDTSSGVTCTVLHSLCTFGVTFWMDRTSGIQISLDGLRSSLSLVFLSLTIFFKCSWCSCLCVGPRSVCNNYLLAHFCASLVGHTCVTDAASFRISLTAIRAISYSTNIPRSYYKQNARQQPLWPRWQGSFAALSPP